MKYKIITVIILVICCIFSFKTCSSKDDLYHKTYSVTGTIYGMSVEAHTTYKSTKINTEYRVAVRPDDNEMFTDFDTCVNFSSYSKFKVGDKITFPNIEGRLVLREMPIKSEEVLAWFVIAFIIISFSVILTISLICEIYETYMNDI